MSSQYELGLGVGLTLGIAIGAFLYAYIISLLERFGELPRRREQN